MYPITKPVTKQRRDKLSVEQHHHIKRLPSVFKNYSFWYITFLFAQWQSAQFKHLTDHPQEKYVVLTMDFAENLTCFSQNETHWAHWAKDSVTIHPAIIRYKCQKCTDSDLPVIVDGIIDMISHNLQHGCHAVHHFLKLIFKHLK